ncbi:MAG TPA: YlqD family protein [bacterium]|nr:YlqD family protein [bacterium]
MGISINRPVVIKAIVTESFKRLYIQDLEEAIKRVDAIQQQLISQIRRAELERTLTPQARAIRQQLELDAARQDAAKAELEVRLREAQQLALNSEFTQGTVESLVEVNVGDNLFTKLGRTEIVVKDGIIMEIREQ